MDEVEENIYLHNGAETNKYFLHWWNIV